MYAHCFCRRRCEFWGTYIVVTLQPLVSSSCGKPNSGIDKHVKQGIQRFTRTVSMTMSQQPEPSFSTYFVVETLRLWAPSSLQVVRTNASTAITVNGMTACGLELIFVTYYSVQCMRFVMYYYWVVLFSSNSLCCVLLAFADT